MTISVRLLMAMAMLCSAVVANELHPPSASEIEARTARGIAAMRAEAEARHLNGVAVIAFFEGDSPKGWVSHMAVVGSLRNSPPAGDQVANLLAIAYQKAGESADSLKDSGKAGRKLLVGETGWGGSRIKPAPGGHWVAAFSGGKDSDDQLVSDAGIESAMREVSK
ncbi:MAG: hypothetical protein SFV32_09645 [Opitutaceae bacterium]|nr:hypothetical protein [Opitutaceae bacterium]